MLQKEIDIIKYGTPATEMNDLLEKFIRRGWMNCRGYELNELRAAGLIDRGFRGTLTAGRYEYWLTELGEQHQTCPGCDKPLCPVCSTHGPF